MSKKTVKTISKIPDFKSDEEVVKFWDTHELTDYLHELKPVNIEVSLKKHISLRLAERQIKEAKIIANKKSIGYQTLLRLWIQEGINKERKIYSV